MRSDLTVPLHHRTVLSAVVQEGTQESVETYSSIETELATERLVATLASNSIDDGSIPLPSSGAASTRNTLGVGRLPLPQHLLLPSSLVPANSQGRRHARPLQGTIRVAHAPSRQPVQKFAAPAP